MVKREEASNVALHKKHRGDAGPIRSDHHTKFFKLFKMCFNALSSLYASVKVVVSFSKILMSDVSNGLQANFEDTYLSCRPFKNFDFL